MHVALDRVDEFLFLLRRVGVVEAQVAAAVELAPRCRNSGRSIWRDRYAGSRSAPAGSGSRPSGRGRPPGRMATMSRMKSRVARYSHGMQDIAGLRDQEDDPGYPPEGLPVAQLRVQRVAQSVAKQVDPQHGQHDRHARENRDPGAVEAYSSAPPCSIAQAGTGSCTPRPR